MNSKTIIALLCLAAPCLAFSQDGGKYQCSYGDRIRRVEIVTEPGVTVPCEVHYYKDTEAPGEKQVLWSAGRQAGYCEQKTEEFIAKLEGWGWNCGRGEAPAVEPEMAPATEAGEAPAEEGEQDDTDVLSPGNPEG